LNIRAERLQAFASAAFRKAGLRADDSDTVARLMLEADLQGADGHGIFRLPQYIRRIEAGGVNPRPVIRIEREKSAMAVVDGDNGQGHLAMKFAAELAVRKAREAGSAWVGVRRGNHAGPASLYAKMAMREGMIGLYFAVGNANHLPPWGGVEMLLSTNPIAIAIPAGKEPPIGRRKPSLARFGSVSGRPSRSTIQPSGMVSPRWAFVFTLP